MTSKQPGLPRGGSGSPAKVHTSELACSHTVKQCQSAQHGVNTERAPPPPARAAGGEFGGAHWSDVPLGASLRGTIIRKLWEDRNNLKDLEEEIQPQRLSTDGWWGPVTLKSSTDVAKSKGQHHQSKVNNKPDPRTIRFPLDTREAVGVDTKDLCLLPMQGTQHPQLPSGSSQQEW